MTLRHCEVFLAVLDHGGVSAAAKALNVVQPAVSQTLRELEREFDARLFERLGRRLSPTEAALTLARHARRLLTEARELERAMAASRESPLLRIGASATVGAYRLPAVARRLRELAPRLRVVATVDNTDTIERRLLRDELDAGIVEGAIRSRELRAEFLEYDDLALAASPEHPLAGKAELSAEDLRDADVIVREPGSGTRLLLEKALAEAGLALRATWTCSGTDAILAAVRAGLGLAAVPVLALAAGNGGLATPRTPFLDLRREFRLVAHKDKYEGEALRALRSALADTPRLC